MTVPQWNPATQYYPPVLAPDPEYLAQFCIALWLPTATVATKIPLPGPDQATALQNFIRIEAGDTVPIMTVFGAAYNTTFLAHCYDTNEMAAIANSQAVISQAMAATAQTFSGWYVNRVVTVVGGRRLSDPQVPEDVIRYRSAVTWEVVGQAPTITT